MVWLPLNGAPQLLQKRAAGLLIVWQLGH